MSRLSSRANSFVKLTLSKAFVASNMQAYLCYFGWITIKVPKWGPISYEMKYITKTSNWVWNCHLWSERDARFKRYGSVREICQSSRHVWRLSDVYRSIVRQMSDVSLPHFAYTDMDGGCDLIPSNASSDWCVAWYILHNSYFCVILAWVSLWPMTLLRHQSVRHDW